MDSSHHRVKGEIWQKCVHYKLVANPKLKLPQLYMAMTHSGLRGPPQNIEISEFGSKPFYNHVHKLCTYIASERSLIQ
jgi:hypothetical protein